MWSSPRRRQKKNEENISRVDWVIRPCEALGFRVRKGLEVVHGDACVFAARVRGQHGSVGVAIMACSSGRVFLQSLEVSGSGGCDGPIPSKRFLLFCDRFAFAEKRAFSGGDWCQSACVLIRTHSHGGKNGDSDNDLHSKHEIAICFEPKCDGIFVVVSFSSKIRIEEKEDACNSEKGHDTEKSRMVVEKIGNEIWMNPFVSDGGQGSQDHEGKRVVYRFEKHWKMSCKVWKDKTRSID